MSEPVQDQIPCIISVSLLGFSNRIMAPKRRAAAAAKAGGKKAKEEPKDAFTSTKEALLAAGPQVKGRRKVDEHCSLSASGEVRSSSPQSFRGILGFRNVGCSLRCTKTTTACSIKRTSDITITSSTSFK